MDTQLSTLKKLSAAAATAYLLYKLTILLFVADCDLELRRRASESRVRSYFRGKTVWITGASDGIGRALAIYLSRIEGVRLILSSRRKDKLEEVIAKDLHSVRAMNAVLPLDLEDLDSLPGKVKEAEAIFLGGVDVLVNNGGISQRGFAMDTDLSADRKLMTVDYLAPVALAKTLVKAHRTSEGTDGKRIHIVNISSLAGKIGNMLRTSYCGAKFALIGYFDAFRMEHAPVVSVTNVCPGSVRTNVAVNALTGRGDERFNTTDS